MSVAACFFFNYPFARNIPVLREIYEGEFDEVMFIQPLEVSDDPSVCTVFQAAFNFAGFFWQARHEIMALESEYIFFISDDCILNPRHIELFRSAGDRVASVDTFIPQLLPLANETWSRNNHKVASLARFAGNYGLYDQRIENWAQYLPDAVEFERKISELGIPPQTLAYPNDEDMARLSPAQKEVVGRLFGKQREPVSLPYPIISAVSDFFIVKKNSVSRFLEMCGRFSAMNIFSEMATPMALAATGGSLSQCKNFGWSFDWTFGRNSAVEHFTPTEISEIQDLRGGMDKNNLLKHPVKLSKVLV